ncbi:MAG: hypothetical protein LBN95_03310 [Prevotellaceae bacterium]|jgi:hypothetical protein|nr:hypothetical protein [Prevotellaceae bacterium]
MKKTFLLIAVIIAATFMGANAQVTIGSNNTPAAGALLQLIEEDVTAVPTEDVTSLQNATKGLLFPRVSLRAYNVLDPLYGTAVEDADGEWIDAATEEERLRATGMVVFNVNPTAKGLDEGLYVWRINEWLKISEGQPAAVFTPVLCENIVVHGVYTQGKAVTTDNYIEITILNVERPGSYTISAATGNGYNFFLSGVVLDRGRTTIKLPCQGTPRLGGREDNLTFHGIEFANSCIKTIPVLEAEFDLTADVLSVTGTYKKKQPLVTSGTNPNTVRLLVNITERKENCTITPVATNGVAFQPWAGTLVEGENIIILHAVAGAAPTVIQDFPLPIKIHAGTKDTTIYATIPVTLPQMTFAIIGNHNTYSWNATPRFDALTKGNSFGPNGVVKIDEFKLLTGWSFNSVTDATAKLQQELNSPSGKLPDIILYFAHNVSGSNNNSNNINLAAQLLAYINRGGTVIYGADDAQTAPVNTILQGIFPEITTNVAERQISGNPDDDCIYPINHLPNDPVINGPFGDLSGTLWSGTTWDSSNIMGAKWWQEDNASNNQIVVTQLPTDGVQVCSAWSPYDGKHIVPQSKSIVWYSDSKNFFYFGDTCGATTSNGNANTYPSYFYTNGLPRSKQSGHTLHEIYNAALELNAVAWAIRQAADNGINYH